LQSSEAWQHVSIPEIRVHPKRRRCKVRLGVDPPPLAREGCERFPPRIKQIEVTKPSAPPEFRVERLRVAFPIEVTRPIAITFPPPDRPDDPSVLQHSLVNAHSALGVLPWQQGAQAGRCRRRRSRHL